MYLIKLLGKTAITKKDPSFHKQRFIYVVYFRGIISKLSEKQSTKGIFLF